MPDYNYRAIDKSGHAVKGTMAASNEIALAQLLQDTGYWLVECSSTAKALHKGKIRVTRKELIEFCSAMSSMLSAGLSFAACFEIIIDSQENMGFKHVLEDIYIHVASGQTLFDAMEQHKSVFPDQMRNLIKAGEYSGNLPSSFKELQRYFEWTEQLVSTMKQVSIYPAFVLIAVVGFVLLLFTFVVPKFTAILESMNIPLPTITRIVMSIGDFTKDYWWLIVGIPIIVFFIARTLYRMSDSFAFQMDKIKLSLPVFGETIQMIALSRFSNNMAVLIRAGIPILQALDLSKGMVGNRIVAQAISKAEFAVNEGNLMSKAFKEHSVFSPMMLRMIIVGEETGQLEHSLDHVTSRFEEEIPTQVKRIFSLLEPTIMLVLIAIVGTVAMAIFMPLMSMMKGIG